MTRKRKHIQTKVCINNSQLQNRWKGEAVLISFSFHTSSQSEELPGTLAVNHSTGFLRSELVPLEIRRDIWFTDISEKKKFSVIKLGTVKPWNAIVEDTVKFLSCCILPVSTCSLMQRNNAQLFSTQFTHSTKFSSRHSCNALLVYKRNSSTVSNGQKWATYVWTKLYETKTALTTATLNAILQFFVHDQI